MSKATSETNGFAFAFKMVSATDGFPVLSKTVLESKGFGIKVAKAGKGTARPPTQQTFKRLGGGCSQRQLGRGQNPFFNTSQQVPTETFAHIMAIESPSLVRSIRKMWH
jgi:hypothetical protein